MLNIYTSPATPKRNVNLRADFELKQRQKEKYV
jgi:hypothetical protein